VIADLLIKESFLVVIASVMVLVGVMKENLVLEPVYYYIQKYIKNKKMLLCAMSTVYGILPIPGRITVATGMFDTCTDKKKDRGELGILAYLSTHHYYLWSPLEKSVLLVLAGTGMSYIDFISAMGIYIGILLVTTYYYVAFVMKDVSSVIKSFDRGNISMKWGFANNLLKFTDTGVLIAGVLSCCFGVF